MEKISNINTDTNTNNLLNLKFIPYIQDYLNNLFSFYYKIKPIIFLYNEIFYDENLNKLEGNELLIDAIEVMDFYDYELDKCLNNNKEYIETIKEKKDKKNNLFIELTQDFESLTNIDRIEQFYLNYNNKNNNNNKETNFSQSYNQKKNYETDMLVDYFTQLFSYTKINNIIEVGCGKLYQTEKLLNKYKQLRYYGIDKKEELMIKINDIKEVSKEIYNNNINKINSHNNMCNSDIISSVSIDSYKDINEKVSHDIINNLKLNDINFNKLLEEKLLKKGYKIRQIRKMKQSLGLEDLNNFDLFNRIFVINSYITLDNFYQLIKENVLVNDHINKDNTNCDTDDIDNNCILFGLHSCGDLTSNTIRIFVKSNNKLEKENNKKDSDLNIRFKYLAIVGCCLNLLTEKIKETDFIKDSNANKQLNDLDFDIKGNYLDETIKYNSSNKNLTTGYPLSSYLNDTNLKYSVFLSRLCRLSAMNSIIGDIKIDNNIMKSSSNVFYKEKLFLSTLEGFISNFSCFKHVCRFKGLLYSFSNTITCDPNDNGNCDNSLLKEFIAYFNSIYDNITSNIENSSMKFDLIKDRFKDFDFNEFLKEFKLIITEINRNNNNKDANNCKYIKLILNMLSKEKQLYAAYLIKLKFSRIIEYIIAFDRVLFLLENNAKVKISKVFDPKRSLRNLILYAEY